MKPQASPKIAPGAEPEIISAARAGSAEAFTVLYNEHAAEVFRFIQSRVRDAYLAEDLTSETFIRALRRIDTFTWQGAPVAAWLMTIARNIVADHFKSSRTRLEVVAGDLLGLDAPVDSAEDVGLRQLAAAEAAQVLATVLWTLTPQQYGAIQLRFLDELSVAETAAAMDRSEGSVKQLAHRAVASMRARLAVAA